MLEPSDWPARGKVVQGGPAQGSASLPWGPDGSLTLIGLSQGLSGLTRPFRKHSQSPCQRSRGADTSNQARSATALVWPPAGVCHLPDPREAWQDRAYSEGRGGGRQGTGIRLGEEKEMVREDGCLRMGGGGGQVEFTARVART